MDEETRRQQWKEQVDDLYCAIGKFAVKFEHVCSSIQTAIIFMLHGAGLTNQRITCVILAELTAEPLRSLFAALVAETQSLDSQERRIVDDALKRFQVLIKERNVIIHSNWHIGYGNEATTDFSTADGMKHHKSNRGAEVRCFDRKVEDFQALTGEAEALNAIFSRLSGCFSGGHAVKNNFVVDVNGHVSVPTTPEDGAAT